jgi:proteasome lid subunit RPN8/RPN11
MSTSLDVKLQISRRLHDEMVAQAVAELPNECCGLLAGQGMKATHRYPLTNALASPMRYDADPKELLAVEKDKRNRGIEVLAIYHSHPTSEPVPSRTDLEQNAYGSAVIHLIISLKDGVPVMRGWRLTESDYSETGWSIEE